MGYTLGVASDGYLAGCTKTLPIAVNGWLNICDLVTPIPGLKKKVSGGGTGSKLVQYEYITPGKFDYRVYTEEEEILLILKIFLHVNK